MGSRPGVADGWTRRELLETAVAVGLGSAALMTPEAGGAAQPTPPTTPYDPTSRYTLQEIEGWRIRVNRTLPKDHKARWEEARNLLRFQLYQITRRVPNAAVAQLRKVPIWVEWREPHHPCTVYHPGVDWLREHGMNPEKARCVEIANIGNFLAWTLDQPWMVLHELAHAYHDQVLGFENAAVQSAFQRAVDSKAYESVLNISGARVRHYALTNVREYFAELTEAYFGTNDFYPFVRAELKEHDPTGYRLAETVWETAQKQA
jgi:hypothetical protein